MALEKEITSKELPTERRRKNSQVVAIYMPRSHHHSTKIVTEQSLGFKKAFIDTLEGKGRGLLMPFLYHDPQVDHDLDASNKTNSLYGSTAWDAMVTDKNSSYKISSDEISALDFAINHGLIEKLPRHVKIIEYGPGGKGGVAKPIKLIKAIMDNESFVISSYVAIDILNRFATEATLEIHEEFNLRSYAVVGDFTAKRKLTIPNGTDSTPIVINFGGGLANAPDRSNDNGNNPKDNAIECFSQMNRQHGTGSYLLLSYHEENEERRLLKDYERTPALEAFIMSAFVRATHEGIIINPSYNPYKKWKVEPAYNVSEKSVIEYAVCQKSHTLNTPEKLYSFQKGDRLPITLSHKWNTSDYSYILQSSGYDIIDCQRNPDKESPYGVILAKAVGSPKLR